MSTHASEIYLTQLRTLGEGDALWFPEPHTTGEVQIGDVGYVHQGAFIRLFNAINPEEHAPPDSGLPENFTPLDAPRVRYQDVRKRALAPGHHSSKTVVSTKLEVGGAAPATPGVSIGGTWEYRCTKNQGALLILGNFADKSEALDQRAFYDYAGKHVDSWVQYAGAAVPTNVKVGLVRGHVKTTADWTVAAFMASGTKYTASLDGGVSGGGGLKLSISHEQQMTGSVVPRRGDYTITPRPDDAPVNQCVFVTITYVKLRHLLWIRLFGGAGPHQLPDQRDANSGAEGPAVLAGDPQADPESEDEAPPPSDGPMDVVLDYILQSAPDAKVAVCSSEDVQDRLGGDEWPEDMAAWLRENRPQVEVNEDGTGTLSLEEGIRTRRTYEINTARQTGVTGPEDAPPPGGDSANPLPAHEILARGNLVLDSKPRPLIGWPHVSFWDKEIENSSTTVMALSPDGKRLALTCEDTTILVWDVQRFRAVGRLEGHNDTVWCLSFSPDSSRLISGSGDTTAIIWNLASNEAAFTLIGHEADVFSALFSPDNTLVATGSTDCSVRVWDAHTGDLLHTLEDHTAHVMQVVFSPDSNVLASCSDENGALWDPRTGTKLAELRGHISAIWCMSFSHKGDRLVTGSEDATARVWDVGTGAELVTLNEHTSPVWSVAFSPDDNEIVSGSYDYAVVTCDSFTGEQHHVFLDERNPSQVDTVAYSPSGNFLASGSADGHVNLWDAKNGGHIATYIGHKDKVKSVKFSPDGRDLLSSAEDGTARIWSVLDVLRLA